MKLNAVAAFAVLSVFPGFHTGAFSATPATVVELDSPLARSTAATTTETAPYVPNLPFSGNPEAFHILYNGSRRGKMEPCGCRALNLGGIDKEAAVIHAIRNATATSPTLLLDGGGFFREPSDTNARLQTWHLLDALRSLQPLAINVGYPDLVIGLASLAQIRSDLQLPLISSNIISATTRKPVFPDHISATITRPGGNPVRITVLGVTAPNTQISRETSSTVGFSASDAPRASASPHAAARWTIAEMRPPASPATGGASPTPAAGGKNPALHFALTPTPHGTSQPYLILDEIAALTPLIQHHRPQCDVLILLSFASGDRSRLIAKAFPELDAVIVADDTTHYEPEQHGPRQTLLTWTNHEGKYLGQISFSGNAAPPGNANITISRSEPAQSNQTNPDRTHSDSPLETHPLNSNPSTTATLIPILQSITPDPAYTRYITDYTADTALLPVAPPPANQEKVFAGVTSCRTCHAEAYTQWRTHHHSRAMKALVDKNMQFNQDCLKCHTVGFGQPGGFTDLRVTANLSNVQCEVCHGPGEKHAKEQQALRQLTTQAQPTPQPQHPMKMEWDANFCMQCHDPQNDPHFNFEQDIQRVRHKNPAPPRPKPTTATLMM